MIGTFILVIVLVVLLISTVMTFVSRYKKCPSDRILVVYGKVA